MLIFRNEDLLTRFQHQNPVLRQVVPSKVSTPLLILDVAGNEEAKSAGFIRAQSPHRYPDVQHECTSVHFCSGVPRELAMFQHDPPCCLLADGFGSRERITFLKRAGEGRAVTRKGVTLPGVIGHNGLARGVDRPIFVADFRFVGRLFARFA